MASNETLSDLFIAALIYPFDQPFLWGVVNIAGEIHNG